MSNYSWKRIGNFAGTAEADRWCDRQGISRSDSELRSNGDGVELFVREPADEGKEDRPGSCGFY
jgi:hypothetical protein